jgi:copper chaperone CopZ
LLLATPALFAGDKEELPEGQTMASISITGMTCGSCCKKVETAVAELDGVVTIEADYENNVAMVVFVNEKIDLDTIVAAINSETSFKAEAGKTS